MSRSDATIAEALLSYRAHLVADGDDFWPFLRPLNGSPADKRTANKFLLAAIIDYQQQANRAWEQGRRFVEETMGDPPDIWRAIVERHSSSDDWLQAKTKYGLHRWDNAHMRVYRIGKELIERYDGDATRIWNDVSAEVILHRLSELRVGDQISNMIVGALRDTGQISEAAGVKADLHVCRVLGRITQGSGLSPEEAGKTARRLKPDAPWLLDRALYVLGSGDGTDGSAGACRAGEPQCYRCFIKIRNVCAYFGSTPRT